MIKYFKPKLCHPLLLLVSIIFAILIIYSYADRKNLLPDKLVSPRTDPNEILPKPNEFLTSKLQQNERSSISKLNIREKATAGRNSKFRMDRDPVGILLHNPRDKKYFSLQDKEVVEGALKHRIVHLDLKGAPPKMDYLISILPLLKTLGASGILVEYEDMFPYWGDLESISALNAYSKNDINQLIEHAHENNLEIIPLIQTFGHMEFVLKLEEFRHLREVPAYPQAICPTNSGTFPLIKKMIDQIMEVHLNINHIHIGSDEVYNIAECARCQSYISEHEMFPDDLFLKHARDVAKYIQEKYDVQPIMWDDEFRQISIDAIIKADIGRYVDVMVWKYNSKIFGELGSNIWEKYRSIFNGIWIASSFKGASAPNSFLTDIGERLNNNKEWMDVVKKYKSNIKFKGIVLTGWQRFDHFGVLCELLPQGIPSLAIDLKFIVTEKDDFSAISGVGKILGCDSFINMNVKNLEFVNHCSFPGAKVYEITQRLYMLDSDYKEMLRGNHLIGWITDYNVKHQFSNPQGVEIGLTNLSMLLFEYKKLYTDAEKALGEVYDENTVKEWIEQNLDPTAEKLDYFIKARKVLMSKTHWPRRPLAMLAAKDL